MTEILRTEPTFLYIYLYWIRKEQLVEKMHQKRSYIYIYIYVYLSVCLSFCLFIYLSIYLPTYIPIYLSIYLPICISIYLSIYLSTFTLYTYIFNVEKRELLLVKTNYIYLNYLLHGINRFSYYSYQAIVIRP